ncbi:ribonuclease J [Jeotgalibacillus proteolyticus]|uniref:Ribonuclease J n=1 Tax=Jeotgalibacillus proteolyticus TaxID=2082395 RepID=A0A2S5GG87_9BACL|nr:ribonuclease J [Jeotgalibacillus proteolyticus]PPA72009.1 Zn-dependent hydrolase [Jeotgalibacillus proteolyticus]
MSKVINEKIRIIPLGGVGEIGKNMYVIEIDEDLFIIDSGLMFPEEEMYGIDIVIPDFNYIEANKDKVKGIFLTHGHDDAIGSLPYLLEKVKAPVYGSKLTVALAKAGLKDYGFKERVKFFVVHEKSNMKFDTVNVTFFQTTHSIPDSLGIAIHTSEGAIVHTGEFKFDQSARGGYASNIGKMAKLGEKGVFALLSDSTEAERPGHTLSETVVENHVASSFNKAKGRIIVTCYASNLIRIQQVFDVAHRTGRKVAVIGEAVEKVVNVASRLEHLTYEEDTRIDPNEINKYNNDEIVIILSGTHDEPFKVMESMANQTHQVVNIQEGDTVLITFTPSPGMEVYLYRSVNELTRAGANVLTSSKNVHVSGHGSQEDLKMMINLMKPRYFIPIQGEYRHLITHARIAEETSVPRSNIFIADKGDIVEYTSGKMKMSGRVQTGNVLIDGKGVGDVGNIVLRDRRLLSQDGVLLVVVTLNKKTKSIAAGPEVISRGFVYVRESEKLMDESTTLVRNIVEKNVENRTFDWSSIKQEIRDSLNHLLYTKTKRRPMILPIIMEV